MYKTPRTFIKTHWISENGNSLCKGIEKGRERNEPDIDISVQMKW